MVPGAEAPYALLVQDDPPATSDAHDMPSDNEKYLNVVGILRRLPGMSEMHLSDNFYDQIRFRKSMSGGRPPPKTDCSPLPPRAPETYRETPSPDAGSCRLGHALPVSPSQEALPVGTPPTTPLL